MKHRRCCSGHDALINMGVTIVFCHCHTFFMILIDFVSSDGAISVCIKDHQIIYENVGFYGELESIKSVSLIDRIDLLVPGKAN